MQRERKNIHIPHGIDVKGKPSPTVLLSCAGIPLDTAEGQQRLASGLQEALRRVHPDPVQGQALLKVHIGEPKCHTRLKPTHVLGTCSFLRQAGLSRVVTGDTTVAYTGPRGYRSNPPGDTSTYQALAKKHGWGENGPLGTPFIVLDRPCSARAGVFEFEHEQYLEPVSGLQRYKEVFVAGGFDAADLVINHAHLTLHGLAGLAGCVKSIAMGCTTLKGKLRMHQSLLPQFNRGKCSACGRCIEHCPEQALRLEEAAETPQVDPDACIGCGECEAVCARRAIELRNNEISDWERGQATLPVRMSDYTVGLLNGRWQKVIHVLHMVTVTERCDCLNVRQKPLIGNALGILIGKNPFAIDRLAARLLRQALPTRGSRQHKHLLRTADASACYVQETYGITADTPTETIQIM